MVAPALSSARAGSAHTAKFICAQCQGRLSTPRRSFSQFRHLQDNLPFSEKIRRKIWGTDNPPGQTNPYDSSIEGRSKWNTQPGTRTEFKETTIEELDDAIAVQRPYQIKSSGAPQLFTRKAAESSRDYVPAESSIGLQVVRGEKLSSATQRWHQEHPFRGFAPRIPKTGNDAITILSQVMAEAAIAAQTGIPLDVFFNTVIANGDTHVNAEDVTWRYGDHDDVLLVLDEGERRRIMSRFRGYIKPVQNVQSNKSNEEEIHDDEAILENPQDFVKDGQQQENSVVEKIGAGVVTPPTQKNVSTQIGLKMHKGRTSHAFMPGGKVYAPTEAMSQHPLLNGETGPWSRISLADPNLKFAVFKRFIQLSGKRLPDQVLDKVRRVQDLLVWLHEATKPVKIAETLLAKSDIADLPNVTVWTRRVHPMEKEEAVGRLKVIDKAFEDRGLVGAGVLRRRAKLAREQAAEEARMKEEWESSPEYVAEVADRAMMSARA